MAVSRVLDLFCGAGGLSYGFGMADFDVLGGVDQDPDALKTFAGIHPGSIPVQADINRLSPTDLANTFRLHPGDLECLVGGPPCQGFSRNRAFRHRDGLFVDDPRNELYRYFFTFVEYFRPKTVVIENVPEILIKKESVYQQAILEMFDNLGYSVSYGVLNAAEYGVPQWRRRAFFLAGRERQRVLLPIPTTLPGPRAGRRTPTSVEKIHHVRGQGAPQARTQDMFALPQSPTVWEAISDLYGSYAAAFEDDSCYASDPATEYQSTLRCGQERVSNHFPWPLSQRQLQRIQLLGEGQSQAHLPPELQTKDGYGSAYRRMQSDAQALTLTTWMFHPGSGMFTHPFADRVVTVREAARLQSFPDEVVFQGRYHAQCRQVGNAVAPLVAYSVARAVSAALT